MKVPQKEEIMEFRNLNNSLYLLTVILVVLTVHMGYKKKNRLLEAFSIHFSRRIQWLKNALVGIGVLLVVLAAMGPAVQEGVTEVKTEGLDIYILLDTSKSMLAEDAPPSRLAQAKGIVRDLLAQLHGDRVGFIPFAASAYVQMPLTDDYDLAEMFLEVTDTDMISGGGSDVAYGIQVAVKAFEEGTQGDKVILLLSDGEEHDEASLEAVQKIGDSQIRVISIGIGTSEGSLIPEYNGAGTAKTGYLKDGNGQPVLSRLNEGVLKELSAATGGRYYHGQSVAADSSLLIQTIDGMTGGNQLVRKTINYKHYYQYFLGAGLLFLLAGLLLPERQVADA